MEFFISSDWRNRGVLLMSGTGNAQYSSDLLNREQMYSSDWLNREIQVFPLVN
jgi:hypothetical protein